MIFRKTIFAAVCLGIAASTCADNVPYAQAEKIGVKKCLPSVKFITNFIIGDGSAGANSTWSEKTPDKQIFSTVIERNYSDGPILTDVTVSPVTSGECATTYSKIMYWPKSCLAVSKENFEKAKYKGAVNKDIAYLDDDGVDVYLMPAGPGCTMVRKEILMNANSAK